MGYRTSTSRSGSSSPGTSSYAALIDRADHLVTVNTKSPSIPPFLCSTVCSAENVSLPAFWQGSLVVSKLNGKYPLQCLSPDQLSQRGWKRGIGRNLVILVRNAVYIASFVTKPTCKRLVIILPMVPRSLCVGPTARLLL